MMSASQAILRRVVAATGPVNTKFPVPVVVPVCRPDSGFGAGSAAAAAGVRFQAVLVVALWWWGRRSW
jgi:hypothetical protein